MGIRRRFAAKQTLTGANVKPQWKTQDVSTHKPAIVLSAADFDRLYKFARAASRRLPALAEELSQEGRTRSYFRE
jgi:hypothetical protein